MFCIHLQQGPYQVIGRNQSVYIIEDLVRGKQIRTHVHNLRPFILNPAQVHPQDVAQQNEQEFIVGEILVRWAGYDVISNSWEQYKALMHVDQLNEYLREHRMRSLIPKEHKKLRRIKIFLDFPTEIGFSP